MADCLTDAMANAGVTPEQVTLTLTLTLTLTPTLPLTLTQCASLNTVHGHLALASSRGSLPTRPPLPDYSVELLQL